MVCAAILLWLPPNAHGSTVTGDHAFQAPDFDNEDRRGPCPGLNALANHGYIPRTGIVSVGGLQSGLP